MIKKIACTPLFVIVLVNLILKLVVFCYLSPWDKTTENTNVLVSDSRGYESVAENLIHHHTFAPPKDTININKFSELQASAFLIWYPDGWMMPAYPVFLASVYSFTGIKPYAAIFIQILLSLISVVLVYRICMLLFENIKIAIIAALLFALDIHSIYVANQLLTDTLYVLLFLSGIYYFLKALKTKKLNLFYVAIIFMGLTCLTRLVVLVYPVILILILLVFSKQQWKWKLKAIMSYILVFAFMNGIWIVRNHSQYGKWEITSHGGYTLLMFNTCFTKERITHESVDSVRVFFQKQADSAGFRTSKNIFEQSTIYSKVASSYLKQHKGMYLLTNMQGCLNMFLSLGNRGMAKTLGWTNAKPGEDFAELTPQRIGKNFSSDARETILGVLIMVILAVQYMGALYGIIKLRKARHFMLLSLIILTILYYASITGILGNYRFKLPVVPFICIAAGYGYAMLKNKGETPVSWLSDKITD